MPTKVTWGNFFKAVQESEDQWIVVLLKQKRSQEGKEVRFRVVEHIVGEVFFFFSFFFFIFFFFSKQRGEV